MCSETPKKKKKKKDAQRICNKTAWATTTFFATRRESGGTPPQNGEFKPPQAAESMHRGLGRDGKRRKRKKTPLHGTRRGPSRGFFSHVSS